MEKASAISCLSCGHVHNLHEACTNLPEKRSSTEPLLPHNNTSRVGQQFGSFRAVRLLGEGGMGSVYLGEHSLIGSKVAIKILHEHLAVNPQLVQRFYAEAKAVNLIGHANIINIFDMNFIPPRLYYLIMEYLEGHPLNNMLTKPLDCAVALEILEQVCEALDAAHKHGVVHRDLKPENIFITKAGRHQHFVKVLDFGIAKLFAEDIAYKTASGLIVGTPEYMAPEQTSGLPVDAKADIYSLGVVAYAMSTAKLPFGGGLADLLVAHRERPPTPPKRLNPKLSKAWSNAILKALSKNPEDRYATPLAFAEALSVALNGTTLSAHAMPLALTQKVLPKPPPALPALEIWDETLQNWSSQKTIAWNRNGCFIENIQRPPLFSRLRLRIAGQLVLEADVIQHVRAEQSPQWNLPEGYGLQFAPQDASSQQMLAAICQGAWPEKPDDSPLNAQAEAEVAALEKHFEQPNPYVQLELPEDAEFSNIRARIREIHKKLQSLETQNVSDQHRQTIQKLKDKLEKATSTIGSPLPRASFDLQHKNFRGIARCLCAGLGTSDAELLRKNYLSLNPKAEGAAHFKMLMAEALFKKGNVSKATLLMEEALSSDPLNLSLHQRYWTWRKGFQEPPL